MLLTYFNDIAPGQAGHGRAQPWFWLGGLIVPDTEAQKLEAKVNALAELCFGSAELIPGTAFHAGDIFARRGNFKTWLDDGKRLFVLERLVSILDDFREVKKVYIRVDPRKMVDKDPDDKAFIFFIEKVSDLISEEKDRGVLFADPGSNTAARANQNLSRYRATGTPFRFGKTIDGVIDAIYTTPTHASRMLQLAQTYTFIQMFCTQNNTNDPVRERLEIFIRKHTRLLDADRRKLWPTDKSWYPTHRKTEPELS